MPSTRLVCDDACHGCSSAHRRDPPLIVSALSAWYTRQQARTEQDRRLSERTPKISARLYESSDPGQPWFLELHLQHDTPSGPRA
jgi:hypothetical protein